MTVTGAVTGNLVAVQPLDCVAMGGGTATLNGATVTITFDNSGVLGMIVPVDGTPTTFGATISSPVNVQNGMLVASNATLTGFNSDETITINGSLPCSS